MVKVTAHADCGNAPKKLVLRDLNIAFAEGNVDAILAVVSDDITWHIVGERRIEGKTAFAVALEDMQPSRVAELVIDSIITHGKEAAANGEIVMQDGQRYAFCDVYRFGSGRTAPVKAITSYLIDVTEPSSS